MIFSIGHSTRSADEFLALLEAHDIRRLGDIRTIPRSRRHPQFAIDELSRFLAAHGIVYEHFPELGGLRKPRPDSVNTAWRHSSFRGYADYMQTTPFLDGVGRLLAWAGEDRAAVMCAEAVWWQCHRRLLADALVVRGVPVYHVVSMATPKPHELSEFARAEGTRVTYPGLV